MNSANKMKKGLEKDPFKQIAGVEPVSPAWEAGVLPMNHICTNHTSSRYNKTASLIVPVCSKNSI